MCGMTRVCHKSWAVLILVTALAGTNAVAQLNILLITADDLGLQLSCYGDTTAETPHLDRLAKRSVLFRTAYVSQASCSSSRSTMLTGLYPHANGQYGLANTPVGFRLHQQLLPHLLPNVLRRHGYRTGIVGKLHVNPEDAFEFDLRTVEGFGARDVRRQVDLAEQFIASESGQPWFLMLNLFDPHVANPRNSDGSRGPQYFPDQVKRLPERLLTAADVSAWPWQGIDTPRQLAKIAGYYNCVQRIDIAVGLLMDMLRETGADDDTLIIFLGDHGPPFVRGKTSCYESGLRVPFIVNWPGVSEPHVSRKLVSAADIFPTILDAANVGDERDVHGRSLRAVLRPTGNANWRKTLVAEFHFHGPLPFFPRRAITDGRYKLIHNLRAGTTQARADIDGDDAYAASRDHPASDPLRLAFDRLRDPPEWELYDLENDPYELDNRAGESTLNGAETQLRASLHAWQDQTDDRFRDAEYRRMIRQQYALPD